MNRNNKFLKILTIFLIVTGIVIIGFGVYIQFIGYDGDNTIKEDTPEQVLDKLSIGNYFKYILNEEIELNKNLLNISSDDNMMKYVYSSDKIKHYRISFPSGTEEGDITFVYIKYNEYVDFHNKFFDINPKIEIEDRDVELAELTHISEENYELGPGEVARCNKDNPNDCYIFLTRVIENKNNITFSDLAKKNGIINGNVRLQSEDGNILDAEFTLNFENKNYNYIIKSLILNSISSAVAE